MIHPINGHILIEPIPHEEFVQSSKDIYEEIGTVIDYDPALEAHAIWNGSTVASMPTIKKGCKIYFDAWLVGKFPGEGGKAYWLVSYDDVKAVEYKDEVSA